MTYTLEGILLPRNPDGTYQWDENTIVTEEAVQAMIDSWNKRALEQETPGQREARELRERACEASTRVVRLVKKGAPIEQVEYADDEATDLWLKTWAQERLNKAEETPLELSPRDSQTFAEALQTPWTPDPDLQAELDMLHEGCPQHGPVE